MSGPLNEGVREAEVARQMAEFPFRRASMEARNAEMRAAGFVFHGCFPNEGAGEMSAAEAHRVAVEWSARFAHGVEGPHFVSCGHPPSHVPMHRRARGAHPGVR